MAEKLTLADVEEIEAALAHRDHDYAQNLFLVMARPIIAAARAGIASPAARQMSSVDVWQAVDAGFEAWKAKPHNARWWKLIDGTPIPNDVRICIIEAVYDALSAAPAAGVSVTAEEIGRQVVARMVKAGYPVEATNKSDHRPDHIPFDHWVPIDRDNVAHALVGGWHSKSALVHLVIEVWSLLASRGAAGVSPVVEEIERVRAIILEHEANALIRDEAGMWARNAARAILSCLASRGAAGTVSAGALKSNDGLFLCTPDHAAAVAYMMSEAEAAIIRCRADTTWVSDILIKYLEGEISSAEARAEFREDGISSPERASAEKETK